MKILGNVDIYESMYKFFDFDEFAFPVPDLCNLIG